MQSQDRSPRLYCDTGHLVNIANLRHNPAKVREPLRESYSTLQQWIKGGSCSLIFNPAAPLEWVDGGATLETARQLAAVIDSAHSTYEIEMDKFVFLQEILGELHRIDSSLVFPNFETFFLRIEGDSVRRALPVLMHEVPGYIDRAMLLEGAEHMPAEIPNGSIDTAVERAWNFKMEHAQAFRERVEGYKAAFEQDLDVLGTRQKKGLSSRDISTWLTRYLQVDVVIRHVAPAVNPEDLLARIDLSRCPATQLFLNARERRVRAKEPVKENDVDDWLTVPIAAYADVLLTERNLRSYLLQADPGLAERVFHNPTEAVRAMKLRYGSG